MILKEKNELKNKKVLLMLSGGKDSAACLHLLKTNEVNVIAIHFIHNWCYDLVTNEARKICETMNVPLEIYDFSKEFIDSIDGFKGGRPCLLCKEQMYKITLKYALEHHCQYICVGDNANDMTTIARIKKGIVSRDENIFLNSFLSEEIDLPPSIKVIRPIINIKSDDVIKYLEKHNVHILRVGDTGDKYFEYSREGCPVQFHDPGSLITIEDMEKLRDYNTILSEFARNKSIRAAIHIPSEFIVTVPKGYEIEAKEYLISKGVFLKEEKNNNSSSCCLYLICLQDIYENIFEEAVSMYLINRLLERLEIVITEKEEMIAEDVRCYLFKSDSALCNIFISEKIPLINICLATENKYKRSYIENLIVEIFRTYKYSLIVK